MQSPTVPPGNQPSSYLSWEAPLHFSSLLGPLGGVPSGRPPECVVGWAMGHKLDYEVAVQGL